ncbi:MAG: hypothetical protein PHS02_04040 [Candidatus ainarchaeum sp.]|nr:hypothetical protein [Candidatus ainarchaeum sp.]
MKRLLALLILASVAFANFQFQNQEISVKLNEDGSATVEESLNLVVFSQYSMQLYETGYNKNTLSGWQELTNITEIKVHTSAKDADVRGLIIRPQPLEKSLSAGDVWYAQIILDYSVYPYYDKSGQPINGTGLVEIDNYKPRTTRYSLNEAAFNLPRTERGDIRLDTDTTLSITPPANSLITYLNPIPRALGSFKPPARSRTLSWNDLTLVQFSLEYEIEESLDKEVLQFFSGLQDSIRTSLLSTEGFAAVAIAIILIFSYFYLKFSRR